jgi:ABC-type transport system substrate-binding protein
MRGALLAILAVAGASLLVAADGAPRGIKEGGTFRVALEFGAFSGIDPALLNLTAAITLDPACGTLMAYPDKPFPAGARLSPSLAKADAVVSANGRIYTFVIRKDARFSTGAPVTALAFKHALERSLNPAMDTGDSSWLQVVGAKKMLAGKTTNLDGAVARGRMLILRLTKRVRDLPDRTTSLCAVPPSLPADPEGARAPLPSAAPYYVAEYVPGQRLVLERNRFYRGERPHHVARIVADLAADRNVAVDQVMSGAVETMQPPRGIVERAAELVQRYGVDKSQLFFMPGAGVRVFHLNTSRPLFRNNPRLRQAVNFAVDRKALAREAGLLAETPTDHYLLPGTPGYRNERIYPLTGPDLRRAQALAKGHTRSGKAVLYTGTSPIDVAQAQILQQNLRQIGLELEIKQFPGNLFEELAKPGEPFDIGRVRWFVSPSPASLLDLFDGRTIGQPGNQNWSYFNSPKYNRLLDRAGALTGQARYRAYAELDRLASKELAPGIPTAVVNAPTFVSAKVGCIVLNPWLDLTAVCLK